MKSFESTVKPDKCPKNKKECFDQLDEMLSETDKQAIIEAKDIIEFHFTLGLWIRNNWLYDCRKSWGRF